MSTSPGLRLIIPLPYAPPRLADVEPLARVGDGLGAA